MPSCLAPSPGSFSPKSRNVGFSTPAQHDNRFANPILTVTHAPGIRIISTFYSISSKPQWNVLLDPSFRAFGQFDSSWVLGLFSSLCRSLYSSSEVPGSTGSPKPGLIPHTFVDRLLNTLEKSPQTRSSRDIQAQYRRMAC